MAQSSTQARRKPRRNEAKLAFDALYIEGGLLAPEWLAKVARLDAGGQSEADYRVLKGLNLRDEIGRYWRVAQALWADFAAGRSSGADPKILTERFVVPMLRDAFGWSSLTTAAPALIAERTYPIGYAALGGRVPVVLAPAGSGLDTLAPSFGDGMRRRSAFGLAQEYMNAAEGALWGLASDGVTLRIVRDNASLTRPAWVEANLGRIFTEERYADFAALWLLAHETRFGKPDQPVAECALEAWRNAGREEGTRAREHLRRGVEEALVALGNGFLSHPENAALRASLHDGSLKEREFFNQLLRLVYRLIFLLTVEERGLLHPDGTQDAARALFAEGYSLRRLRERSAKRSAHDQHWDLWEAVKVVFRGVGGGEPRLGLPALAGIFAKSQCPALDAARLPNRALLLGVFKLSWLREASGLSRVNWRDMGPEELGSVYESLLELVPVISVVTRSFSFAKGDETKGNARKTSGSYYTPDSLVQVLLDSALEPVIKETMAANPTHSVEALLNLTIVDPACGSGHFLLAAARRLAAHVARLQTNGTPSAAEYRRAVRQVVGRCIYGVDLNAMAVELCKVALWMEAVEPGLPLTFLDAHIRHGNALLGTTPELMEKGIPNAAWEPIEGDDKKVASALKKRNGKEAGGQTTMASLWGKPAGSESEEVARAVAALEAASDANPGALAAKESKWAEILASGAYRHQKFVADAWCAAFVWPKPSKDGGPIVQAAPTMGLWADIRDGKGSPPALTVKTVEELAEQYHFFHWHLAFPTVFQRGGFDVVLGNPPWERVKLQEQEFFAARNDEIAKAANAAARKKLIAALPETDDSLWKLWCEASREAEGQSHFVRNSGRYPLCGKGDINTYALFAEHNRSVLGPRGRAGFIVPTGLITDDTTSGFFRSFVESRKLVSVFDFENTAGAAFFPGVGHRRFKFCLVTLSGLDAPATHRSSFAFYAEHVSHLRNRWDGFTLSAEELALFNPNSHTCPVFRDRRDAEIAAKVYALLPVLVCSKPAQNPWGVRFMTMLHMANDSGLFLSEQYVNQSSVDAVPVYEAKMMFLFDARYGDYRDQPANSENTSLPTVPVDRLQRPDYRVTARYYVRRNEMENALKDKWQRAWYLAWRDIARSGDERTMIMTAMPRVAAGHTLPILLPGATDERAIRCVDGLQAFMSSIVFDFIVRLKNGGTHLTFGLVEQLPTIPPERFEQQVPLLGSTLIAFVRPRVLELNYTHDDLCAWAAEVGWRGPPFRHDPDRRALMRAELDAAFFHFLGFPRAETEYILSTFRRLEINETSDHGEYRTKRVILEIYDAMAAAARTGVPYVTRLDPPPADPRVAHPPRPPVTTTNTNTKRAR